MIRVMWLSFLLRLMVMIMVLNSSRSSGATSLF